MEFSITKKTAEPLLHRTHVDADISFYGKTTPSKTELAQKIAHALKTEEKLVVIKKVDAHFGSTKAKVSANVYDDEKNLSTIEPPVKKKDAAEGAK